MIKKKLEKVPKYKKLTIEIQHTWSVKAKLIPLLMEATGTI